MEAVVALRDAPHRVPGLVVRQAYRAWPVVGPRQPLALSQHDLWERLDGWPLEAQDHHLPQEIRSGCGCSTRVIADGSGNSAEGGGLDADASVGGEHDGGDEDEDADGDGYAVAKADAGGGYSRRVRRGHESPRSE